MSALDELSTDSTSTWSPSPCSVLDQVPLAWSPTCIIICWIDWYLDIGPWRMCHMPGMNIGSTAAFLRLTHCWVCSDIALTSSFVQDLLDLEAFFFSWWFFFSLEWEAFLFSWCLPVLMMPPLLLLLGLGFPHIVIIIWVTAVIQKRNQIRMSFSGGGFLLMRTGGFGGKFLLVIWCPDRVRIIWVTVIQKQRDQKPFSGRFIQRTHFSMWSLWSLAGLQVQRSSQLLPLLLPFKGYKAHRNR